MPYEAMENWLLNNYDGSLCDMPDSLLAELLGDRAESGMFAWELFARSSPPRIVEATARVRQWLIVERLRRMGKLGVTKDVPVKQLAVADPRGLVTPAGEPFRGEIVEVSPGVVSIVGEEIRL